MFSNLTGWHALIILAIVVLIFGAARLPALAKAVGQSTKIFKNEMAKPGPEASAEPASSKSVEASPALTQKS